VRAVFILLALSIILAWLGYEMRGRDRALSNVLFVFAGLFAAILIGAFLDFH
jgi:hypothetical protein